jgi:hypothetical protein
MGATMKSNLTGLMPNYFHLMILVNRLAIDMRTDGFA